MSGLDDGAGQEAGGAPETGHPVLVHDGTFTGFLCAAAEAINMERAGHPLPPLRAPGDETKLFDEPLVVQRDELRARRLWERLSRKAGASALLTCLGAFCSDVKGKDDAICRVLARIAREGKSALDDLSHPDVCLVEKASIRTGAQAHLVTGLIRFSELADGSWYAVIEPECNVLPLIAGHFAARFPTMCFVIHDSRRKIAMLHQPGSPYRLVRGFFADSGSTTDGAAGSGSAAGDLARGDGPPLSAAEILLREAWARYFSSITIAERKNPRLQAGRMPKKYWKNLPEMGANGITRTQEKPDTNTAQIESGKGQQGR